MPESDNPRGSPYSSSAPPVRSTVPPPDVVEQIREAQEGPPESRGPETLVLCPVCNVGHVTPFVAAEVVRLLESTK